MSNSGEFQITIYSNQVDFVISKKQFKWLTPLRNNRTFPKPWANYPVTTALGSQRNWGQKDMAKGIQQLKEFSNCPTAGFKRA